MTDKYESNFLDKALELDNHSNAHGDILKDANEFVQKKDGASIRSIIKKIQEISASEEYAKEVKQFARALKDSLVQYCGYITVKKACNDEELKEDCRSLNELLDELNSLIGLKNVKQQIDNLIRYQTVQQMRRERGLNSQKNTLHMAFIGNPGTGKTTVARIVGHIYKKIGLLSKGHFIEVSRTDLIAGYQGQTALKVKKVIDKAKGGVLFIDEAYSITENDHSDSYGRECLTELTKALEDYRDDLVVIVAGYTEPMNVFFDSNPGLKSRFNTFIEFGDYSEEELIDIISYICKQNDYKLDKELVCELKDFFAVEISKKEEYFANARLARNIYDDLVMNHAKRVYSIDNPSDDDLSVLLTDDFKVKEYE